MWPFKNTPAKVVRPPRLGRESQLMQKMEKMHQAQQLQGMTQREAMAERQFARAQELARQMQQQMPAFGPGRSPYDGGRPSTREEVEQLKERVATLEALVSDLMAGL